MVSNDGSTSSSHPHRPRPIRQRNSAGPVPSQNINEQADYPRGSVMATRASTALLSVDQAADALGVTPRMIRRLTSNRRLPFVKVGRLGRIREDDIAQCVEELTVPVLDCQ